MAATEVITNRAVTNVTSGGSTAPAGGTVETWTVVSSTGFPAAATGVTQFHVADSAQPTELIAVTNVSGTTWTVTRGAESTTPVAHAVSGFTVYLTVTAGFLNNLTSVTAAAFSPLTFGAAGNGTTDDTTPVLAAFTAAAAVKGIVDLGTSTFKTTAPIPLSSYLTVRAASQQAGIVNSVSDLFTIAGTVTNVTIKDCSLTAAAGHVFNCATGSSVSFWKITNSIITQVGNGFSIWSMLNGTYIDMLVGDGCMLACAAGATVAPWKIISTNNAGNSNTWRRLRVLANGASVPFFHIENQAAGGYCSDNVFREITAEVCTGGIINALSVAFLTIDAVSGYDVATYSGTLFNIGTGSGSNRSGFIHIKNSGRRGGALAGGAFDVAAASNVVSIILENVGPLSGSGSYSVPSAQTTIITPSASSASDPLNIGAAVNFLPGQVPTAASVIVANDAWYSRLLAGGYAISNIVIDVAVSSGNVSVAAYTGAGSGMTAAPTAARLATSGGVACPAAGIATVSLGSTVTPGLSDWFGLSADNTTATFYRMTNNVSPGNLNLPGWGSFQATAYPLPSTPSGLAPASSGGAFNMRGA